MRHLFTVGIIFSTLSCLAQSHVIAHFPFSGNTNDHSELGNDATNSGATLTSGRKGVSSTAYVFDGVNDDMDISGASGMSPTQSVSIAAWIRVDGTPDTRDQAINLGADIF